MPGNPLIPNSRGVRVSTMYPVSVCLKNRHINVTVLIGPSRSCPPCSSAGCSAAMTETLSLMDLTADPCQDLYRFSCGGWPEVYPPSRGLQHWTNFVRLDRDNLDVIRAGIEGRGKKTYRNKAVKKARSFYYSCLDKHGMLDKLGAKPLR